MRPHRTFSISCRSVGPGGTDILFYPDKEGLKAIWLNENCPYPPAGVDRLGITDDWRDEDTYEAKDGHNVSRVTWKQLEDALAWAIKKGLYEPEKLRRK